MPLNRVTSTMSAPPAGDGLCYAVTAITHHQTEPIGVSEPTLTGAERRRGERSS